LGVIIFSTNPMRKVRIIYWEDSHSGPYIPEPQIIPESSDGLARCSDDRNSKHITKFRADMNATHSLIESLLLSCENKSMQSSR
jgi:hypothetical protein